MKRLIAMAAVFAVAAVAIAGSMYTTDKADTPGIWITGKGDSTVCLYGDDVQGAVLGFYKGDRKKFPIACDFSIYARGREVNFQILDEEGKVHFIPVTALLKLKDLK